MASGIIANCTPVGMAGLSAHSTDRSASLWSFTLPPVKDMGYVTADKQVLVYLYNGSGAPLSLADIESVEHEGISWSPDAPQTIPIGSSLPVDITVGVDGPLVFTATASFLSACGFDPTLTLFGTRAPQLSGDVGYLIMPHNWESGLDESLDWKTDVMIAHDRTEQRIKLRTLPRRAFDFRYLLTGAARRKFETWLSLRKTHFLFSPVWRDEQRITAPIIAGQSTVMLDPSYLDFAVNRWIAVYTSWDHMEIRTVSGVGAGFVSVDAPFSKSWPVGTTAAPCRYGVCLEQRKITRFTEEVGEYRIRFEALNESDMPMESPTLYRTVPVCPALPNWLDPEESIDNKWVRLDNDTGIIEYDIQSIEPILRRDVQFLVIGRAAIDEMLRFLFYCSGRLAPFWIAANDRSFEVAVPAAIDATAITIEPIDYDFCLSGSPQRENIEMITTDGTIIRRKITAVETLPDGTEKLSLDSALPVAISKANLNRCSWLEQCRLDSDAVDLHWVAPDCLELTLSIVVLP